MKLRLKKLTPVTVVPVAALLVTLAPTSDLRAQGNIDSIAQREIVRRQEDLATAEKLVAKADAAMAEKKYEDAYVAYLDALDKIPAGEASSKERATVVAKFSKAALAYAEYLIANGHYSEAEQVAKTVLLPEYDSSNKAAIQLLSNLEQPDYYNKTVTPQFAANRDEVTKLLYEADGFYQSGRFDLAITRYEQVLNIDPYNIAARRGMEQVNLERDKFAKSSYDETRGRMLWLVDRAWERPVKRFREGRSTASDSKIRAGIRNTEAINAKLNKIIIPKIDLRDATVREAVEFLKQRSRELDTTTDDPTQKRGVNIVLKVADAPEVPAAPVEDQMGLPPIEGEGAAPAAPVSGNADTAVTLSLTNVPLIEALRYMTDLANLKYKIEPYAVSIVPLTEVTTDLVTKEYRVPPGFIPSTPIATTESIGAGTVAADTTGASRLTGRTNAKDYLTSLGVTFPDGASAQYIPAGSKLIVRNTPDALDLIDSLVDAALGVQPTQVEIESKFVEISQDSLKELGFDWLLGPFQVGGGVYGAGGTQTLNNSLVTNPTTGLISTNASGSLNPANYPFVSSGGTVVGTDPVTSGLRSGMGNSPTAAISANSIDALIRGVASGPAPAIFGMAGIFSNPQFQVVIRALDQKKGVDLLSAPKVTTKSGRKAVVRVVREFPYPSEFNPPEPPPPATNDSIIVSGSGQIVTQGIVTPSTPTAFETRNLGVTLEVNPVIGPDGYTIDLDLSPEVVEFDGFINYGSPILGAAFNGLAIVNTVLTPNVVNQPIFSTRKVTTSVSIWDGQTVALGGLIREDVQKVQDKVPLLGDIPIAGRLFRSDVDQKIKRNLIIFVTARLMDAEGRPIRQDEDQEEMVEPLGLPQTLPPPTFQEKTFGK